MSLSATRKVLLTGDSDIARWPPSLFPNLDSLTLEIDGYSRATLDQVVVKIPSCNENIILVVCAGENDDGHGLSVDDSLGAMDRLLLTKNFGHLIFLGPKFEPWLNEDASSRKTYAKLDKGFRRRCEKVENVTYIECLTMFCGDTANVKGAVLGGRAKAQQEFFEDDQLHLNEKGYKVWKTRIESELSKLTVS